ncbi:hypothetical protein A2U01_0110286, partial [Trifolium medium]|nr:hypothetical protein [Trifolium medium]
MKSFSRRGSVAIVE